MYQATLPQAGMSSVEQVDKQLSMIDSVINATNLPDIDPEIKLDLAMSPVTGTTPEQTGQFLYEMAQGLNTSYTPAPQATDALSFSDSVLTDPNLPPVAQNDFIGDPFLSPEWDEPDFGSGIDQQVRKLLAGVTGNPAPKLATDDATQRMQMRLKERGLIDADAPVDGRWTPELNAAYQEDMQQTYAERKAGNAPGKASLTTVLDWMDDYTSPTGLLSAAAQIGVIPDLKSIQKAWNKGDDGWSFGDAIGFVTTTAIDGVLPVVNTALLFSGVGSAVAFARGAQGIKALEAVKGAKMMARFEKFGEASLTSQKLMGFGTRSNSMIGGLALKGGSGLEKWRAFEGVKRTKGVVQSGMRVGFVSTLESKMFGSNSVGLSIPDVLSGNMTGTKSYNRVEDFKKWRTDNTVAASLLLPVELAIAPQTVFDKLHYDELESMAGRTLSFLPKTSGADISREASLRAVKEGVLTLMSGGFKEVPERARLAYNDALRPILRQEKMVATAHRTTEQMLAQMGDAEKLADFRRLTDEGDVNGALRAAYGLDDDDQLAEWFHGTYLDHNIEAVSYADTKALYPDLDETSVEFLEHKAYRKRYENESLKFYPTPETEQDWVETLDRKLGFNKLRTEVDGYRRDGGLTIEDPDLRKLVQAEGPLTDRQWFEGVFSPVDEIRDAFRRRLTVEMEHHNELAVARLNDMAHGENAFGAATEASFAGYLIKNQEGLFNFKEYSFGQEYLNSYIDEIGAENIGLARIPGISPVNPKTEWSVVDEPEEALFTRYFEGRNKGIWDEGSQYSEVVADLSPRWKKDQINPPRRTKSIDPTWLEENQEALTAKTPMGLRGEQQIADVSAAMLPGSALDPLVKNPAVQNGLYTLQKVGKDSKQAIIRKAAQYDMLRLMEKTIQQLPPDQLGWGAIEAAMKRYGKNNQEFFGITDEMISSGVKQFLADKESAMRQISGLSSKSDKQLRKVAKVQRQLEYSGLAPEDALEAIRHDIDLLEHGPHMQAWNIPPELPGAEKFKMFRSRVKVAAAELDLPDEARKELEALGYVAVVTRGGRHPDEMYGLGGSMPNLTRQMLRRHTLGTFFSPQSGKAISELRWRSLNSKVAKVIQDNISSISNTAGYKQILPDDETVQIVSKMLKDLENNKAMLSSEVLKDAEGGGKIRGAFARAQVASKPNGIFNMPAKEIKKGLLELAGSKDKSGKLKYGLNLTPEMAWQIGVAVKQSINVGGSVRGLAAMEDYVRSNSVALQALKGLGNSSFTGDFSAPRRGLGLVAGGVAGSNYDEDASGGERLRNIATGGVLGLVSPTARMGAAAVTANASRDMAESMGVENADLLGLAGGAIGALGAPKLAKKSEMLMLKKGWGEYGNLPDRLVQLRDFFRFSLNPWFDVNNYTESLVLAQVGNVPEAARGKIPLKSGWKAFERRYGEDTAKAVTQRWNEAARARGYNSEIIDEVDKYALSRGILGFSPEMRMRAAFGHMLQAGVGPDEAYEATQKIFAYGTQGRSAAEQSVNFIFFPFSFQKKAIKELGRFMMEDMGRMILLNDSLHIYRTLDEKYDLNTMIKERFPIAEELQKLNSFSYGISLGELGGINKPLYDLAMDNPASRMVADPVANLFLPQGWQLRTEEDAKSFKDRMDRLVPIGHVFEQMLEDDSNLREQVKVINPGSTQQMTKSAEIKRANEELDKIRDQFDEAAKANGLEGINELMRSQKKALQPVKQLYQDQLFELGKKYPDWFENRQEGKAIFRERQDELKQRLDRAERGEPVDTAETGLYEFQSTLDQIDAARVDRGLEKVFDDPEYLTGAQQQMIRDLAADIESRFPGFAGLYRRFYQRSYGVLEATY